MNIQDALVKLEYKEPDIEQLAILHNFTSDEQKMIKMFWEPAFNQGWLYLSDEIILEQMTNEKGRMASTDFYNRVLLTEEYIENIGQNGGNEYIHYVDSTVIDVEKGKQNEINIDDLVNVILNYKKRELEPDKMIE